MISRTFEGSSNGFTMENDAAKVHLCEPAFMLTDLSAVQNVSWFMSASIERACRKVWVGVIELNKNEVIQDKDLHARTEVGAGHKLSTN